MKNWNNCDSCNVTEKNAAKPSYKGMDAKMASKATAPVSLIKNAAKPSQKTIDTAAWAKAESKVTVA